MQDQLREIFARHSGAQSDLIPILQEIQDEVGYIPREAMTAVARELRVPESTVYGVATFYAQFYLSRQGRHKIKVCQGTACHVRGAPELIQTVRDELGIEPGGTTDDYEFTLERVACFGSCALAPVVVLDGKVYAKMTPARVRKLLK
ncbi:MAG: NADH-quinone oxidoreductase subunit NuoE [Planctomycetota bacterium]|jgi:NADH-quinone oxidoreductase subunit E